MYLFVWAALGLHCCAWAFFSCIRAPLLSSCDVQASYCSGFSSCRARAPGSQASVVAAHWCDIVARPLEHRPSSCGTGLSCSEACGIFLDQRSNLCLLHWQADSLPLTHPGSPLRLCILPNSNIIWGFPGGSSGKESACNAGDLGLTLGLGRSPDRKSVV